MPQVHLDDQAYKIALQRAAAAGYPSVGAYIAAILMDESSAHSVALDHPFASERTAELDREDAEHKQRNWFANPSS